MQMLKKCSICKKNIARFNCIACGKHVCAACYSNGLCAACREGKSVLK